MIMVIRCSIFLVTNWHYSCTATKNYVRTRSYIENYTLECNCIYMACLQCLCLWQSETPLIFDYTYCDNSLGFSLIAHATQCRSCGLDSICCLFNCHYWCYRSYLFLSCYYFWPCLCSTLGSYPRSLSLSLTSFSTLSSLTYQFIFISTSFIFTFIFIELLFFNFYVSRKLIYGGLELVIEILVIFVHL